MILDILNFNTKKELIDFVKTNKSDLIEFKKSQTKFTNPFGSSLFEQKTNKAINTGYIDDVDSGVIKRTIIGNTYNYMDSHFDVHLKGIFSKSISERKDKIWHLHDHIHQVTAKVGKFSDVYEKEIDWADLGINKMGTTMALMADSNISKQMNPTIFNEYLKGEIDQHSVGMVYVKIELAIDDDSDSEGFGNWNKYLPILGNPQKAIDAGFFFVVKEAKLIEISAVLEGSNDLTPTLPNKITPKEEPSKDTQKEEPQIDYAYLIKNFKLN